MEIIIKNFQPHYNMALGKIIVNERQYKEEIKRGGYIPYEQAQEQVASNMEKRKNFQVSDKAMDWMRDVKSSADSKGNIKMSDRQIEAMGSVTKRSNPAWEEAMAQHAAQKEKTGSWSVS
jgi:hypothetical protein